MSTAALLAVDRIALIEPSAPLLSTQGWLWLVLFLAVCLSAGGLISIHAWRDRRSTSPEERSFRVLAGALGLGRKERSMVRSLAVGSGIPEIGLLLSEHAFDRAAEQSRVPEAQELRRRLFSDRST